MAENSPRHTILLHNEVNFAPVILWPCSKVNPIDGATLFKKELIKVLLLLVGNVYKDGHVTDGLLLVRSPYIYRTTLILGRCN